MDGEGGVSQINDKHVIFYHKLGKFVFKKLVHLDECNHLKLPSSIFAQLESSITFFFLFGRFFVTLLELGSLYILDFIVCHNVVLFTEG